MVIVFPLYEQPMGVDFGKIFNSSSPLRIGNFTPAPFIISTIVTFIMSSSLMPEAPGAWACSVYSGFFIVIIARSTAIFN